VDVDDDTAHRGRQVVGRPDGVVAVEQRVGVAQRVGVNQDLVAIEPKPSAVKVLRSVDAVGVMRAWLETPDIDVPKKESLVRGGSSLMI
jgi:hypothetical protein